MATDLRNKLRRLGVHKGASKIPRLPLQPLHERGARTEGLESLVDGLEIDTPYGPAFVHEDVFPVGHFHGNHTLGELLTLSPEVAAQIGGDASLALIDLGRALFLDTETTGLAGGTGTFAFLVGVGAFNTENATFEVQQYFLRSPAEEPAMLHALAQRLDAHEAVVTFNGRGFDMPLLRSRFTLARMRPRLLDAPHLDLLMPARRVWRGRLESCALSSLEHHILNVQREQADVPGFLIPEMYVRYVRTGDASEMPRVMYHNLLDILSMVSLSTRLITLFAATASPTLDTGADDWLALGKWYDDLARTADAEAALRKCLAARPDPSTRAAALFRLGVILKREGRRDEAVRVWEALSESKTWPGIQACVDLAKHYEWHTPNLERALAWTREALAITPALSDDTLRQRCGTELQRRLDRLAFKHGRNRRNL